MAGEKETGVTLMEMVAAMDAGKMYDKETFPLLPEDNYTSVCVKISDAASCDRQRSFGLCQPRTLAGEEQKEKDVTIANKIKPEDEHLPLISFGRRTPSTTSGALPKSRALIVLLNDKKLKIYARPRRESRCDSGVGEMIPNKKKLLVQYYDGQLSLDIVQLEGKKKMDAASFLNGAISDHVLSSKKA
jgi:methionyl-tRNA formyltransferase